MLDKTIDSALANLRAQIIRGKLDELSQVEALMQFRGLSLQDVPRPRRADSARKGAMRLIVLGRLKEGPASLQDIAACAMAARPELTPEAALQRSGQVLAKLKLAGVVARVKGGCGGWPNEGPAIALSRICGAVVAPSNRLDRNIRISFFNPKIMLHLQRKPKSCAILESLA